MEPHATTSISPQFPLVLYDGSCGLCATVVKFVLKRDSRQQFYFAPLQSPLGQSLLAQHNMPTDQFDSFVLLEAPERIFTRSTAGLRLLKNLGGMWKLVGALMIIPPFIRDGVYDFIARNRKKWFTEAACAIPTAEQRQRFLDHWSE